MIENLIKCIVISIVFLRNIIKSDHLNYKKCDVFIYYIFKFLKLHKIKRIIVS